MFSCLQCLECHRLGLRYGLLEGPEPFEVPFSLSASLCYLEHPPPFLKVYGQVLGCPPGADQIWTIKLERA